MAPSLISRLKRTLHDANQASKQACQRVPLLDMLYHNWHLGLTSFGGPAVHFQIVGRCPATVSTEAHINTSFTSFSSRSTNG